MSIIKQNVIEKERTREFDKQAEYDVVEADHVRLFKTGNTESRKEKSNGHKSSTEHAGRII